MKFNNRYIVIKRLFAPLIIFLLCGHELAAQTTTTTTATPDFPDSYYTILGIGLLTVLVAIIMGFFIFGMGEGKEKPRVIKESVWAKIRQKLNASTPIEKEQDIMLNHSYDGIKELDNKIPPWFSYLFLFSIIFAVYYLLDYHVFNSGKLMYEEYAEEMKFAADQRAALEKSGAFVNESSITALTDQAAIISGKKIFDVNCVACHSAGGAGLVGPNLTDDFWINGGGIKNIFTTIKYGVPAKGMKSWQTQLNPKQMQEAASYILSIHGTNPPKAKPPQGVKYIPESGDSVKAASLQL
jgi:cytochrome c oxidase cbb3-type subunit 3